MTHLRLSGAEGPSLTAYFFREVADLEALWLLPIVGRGPGKIT
jgi:hypothetical protein